MLLDRLHTIFNNSLGQACLFCGIIIIQNTVLNCLLARRACLARSYIAMFPALRRLQYTYVSNKTLFSVVRSLPPDRSGLFDSHHQIYYCLRSEKAVAMESNL